MKYFTYILYSKSLDQFYKGHTSDIQQRLTRHNNGYENFTSKGVPWQLIWLTEKDSKKEAYTLEKKLKNYSRIKTVQFMLKFKDGVVGPDELLFIEQLSGC
ncbi:MAG: GIY-YIG nuclease family protein [Bacteroidia bacterium]